MTSSDIASELRTLIWDIRDLYRELPDTIAHIAGLHAVRYDKRGTGKSTSTDVTIIGGAALVMASAGYDGGVTSARDGNRDHAHDCLPDDPPSVLAILTRIEDVWRTNQHNPAAETTSLDATVNFLLANAPWAAEHHPDINDDLHDLDQLRNRRSSSVEPADFDQFWTDTLGQARQYALDARFERVSTGLTTLDTYDVTFAGFGGHPVKGWFTLPAGTTEPLPVVVPALVARDFFSLSQASTPRAVAAARSITRAFIEGSSRAASSAGCRSRG